MQPAWLTLGSFLLDLLALEARPLESLVIAVVLSCWALGVFERQGRFSPCTVSAFLRYDIGAAISPT